MGRDVTSIAHHFDHDHERHTHTKNKLCFYLPAFQLGATLTFQSHLQLRKMENPGT